MKGSLFVFSPAHADFFDDFSEENLNKWVLNSPTGGVFSVIDGELQQTNTSPGGLNREIVAKNVDAWSDYTLSFKARVVSGFYSNTSFDIFFRLQNQPTTGSSNYGHPGYFLQLHGNGQVNLFKVDSTGNLELIQTSSKTVITPNYTGYQVKITAIGNTIKIYVDDTLMIDAVDSTYKSGSIGFSTVHFVGAYDDVTVKNLDSISGNIKGLQKYSAVCKNLKTGVSKKIPLADGAKEWNCTAAGLKAKKGENVSVTITGVSQ